MVQEALNRTDDYLYALVSNGRTLRLLRDSTSLSGQAYVEFDLEAMFEGDVFSDFVLLYLLLHQSRVEVRTSDGVASRLLAGDLAHHLDRLRNSCSHPSPRGACTTRSRPSARAFFSTPVNTELRRRIEDKEARVEDLHHALLRLVYRLLFLFVAEDRDAPSQPRRHPRRTTAIRPVLLDDAPAPTRDSPAGARGTPTCGLR